MTAPQEAPGTPETQDPLDTPAQRAAASRRAQGLPDKITDPVVLARIAALLVKIATPERSAE